MIKASQLGKMIATVCEQLEEFEFEFESIVEFDVISHENESNIVIRTSDSLTPFSERAFITKMVDDERFGFILCRTEPNGSGFILIEVNV